MTRVAAYCRVSTDQDDQANSFESQQRYFRECIDRNPDWELQDIYADEGLSGTETKKRIRFNQMIQAAREGKIDLIVTKEVSRFARNTVDTLEYTRELRKRGIGVIFLIDNINTLEPDAELRLTIMSSIAQEESRKTSERVKWGQKRQMERGVVFGGSLLGYDVADGKMTVNPEGAAVVRRIFHKYLDERKGSSVIAKELCDEGILSSRGNLKWSASTVLKILKNEKYCGDLRQKKTYTPDYLSHQKKYNKGQESYILIRDHHEPIIDRAVWEDVQRELARRNRDDARSRGHGNRYPLSGKIKCAACGSSFLSRRKKTKSGNSYRVWRCGKATLEGRLHTDGRGNSVGCDIGRQIREDVAMDILKRSVQAVRIDVEGMNRNLTRIVEEVLRDSQDDSSAESHRLERALEAENKKKQRAMEEFFDKTISKSDFQFINQRCDSTITQLQERLAVLQRHQAPNFRAQGVCRDVRAVIRSIITGETADDDFYGRLLHHMTVSGDGRVEVVLNFLPARWFYVLDGLTEYECAMAAQSVSSVPTEEGSFTIEAGKNMTENRK